MSWDHNNDEGKTIPNLDNYDMASEDTLDRLQHESSGKHNIINSDSQATFNWDLIPNAALNGFFALVFIKGFDLLKYIVLNIWARIYYWRTESAQTTASTGSKLQPQLPVQDALHIPIDFTSVESESDRQKDEAQPLRFRFRSR